MELLEKLDVVKSMVHTLSLLIERPELRDDLIAGDQAKSAAAVDKLLLALRDQWAALAEITPLLTLEVDGKTLFLKDFMEGLGDGSGGPQ